MILIQNSRNELLELEVLGNSLDNHIFMISNRSLENNPASTDNVQLTFHELHIHKFLMKLRIEAEKKMKDPEQL